MSEPDRRKITADGELKRMLEATVDLVREVAQREIMPRFLRVSHGQRKDDGSLCSEADLAAQHFLLDRLKEIHPCPIIGEEMSTAAQQASWNDGNGDELGLWCIDPIDGTTNFINGLPFFAVSIAWMRASPSMGPAWPAPEPFSSCCDVAVACGW